MSKEELNLDFQKAYEVFKDTMREGNYLLAVKSALEKQIPKKVEITEDCCICPRCIFDMMGVYDFTDYNTKDPAYCPSCGQALDWGDSE